MTRTLTRPTAGAARRAAAWALVGALTLSLAGCDDGTDDAKDDPTSAPPSTPSSEATKEPSPSEDASPSVTPAAGLELVEETSAVRVPQGWEAAEPLVDWASSADGPGNYDFVQLSDRPNLAGTADLDTLAQAAIDGLPKGSKPERLPDVDLAGSPAYMIAYTETGIPALVWDIVTIRNGHSVGLDISLSKKTAQQDPQLVASVLASFRWLD